MVGVLLCSSAPFLLFPVRVGGGYLSTLTSQLVGFAGCYNLPVTQPHATVAVFPGSFDPFHVGHVAIVERALRIFPRVIVGVLQNNRMAI